MSPFRRALGRSFDTLAPALQHFHAGDAARHYRGRASVEHGTSALARAGVRLGGFPPAMEDSPFAIGVTPQGESEVWMRDFDGFVTRSTLMFDPARSIILERFGPVCCGLVLRPGAGDLHVDVTRLWLLGLPVLRALLPGSTSREWADDDGVFHFDIGARLPGGGLMIRYRGHLLREE